MAKILFGADPEVFIMDKNGKVINAAGLFGGSKGRPVKVTSNSGYLEDNVTLELNPAPTEDIRTLPPDCWALIDAALDAAYKSKKIRYGWVASPAVSFSNEELQLNLKSLEFGCDPDLDAYSEMERDTLCPDRLGVIRCAGGHIHVSIDPWPKGMPKHVFVKFLDAFAYLPHIAHDQQGIRRQFYGLAGLYRSTNYKGVEGIEYRTPSNFWLNSDSKKRRFLESFSSTVHRIVEAMESGKEGELVDIYSKLEPLGIKRSIDSGTPTVFSRDIFDDWQELA